MPKKRERKSNTKNLIKVVDSFNNIPDTQIDA